MNNLDIQKYKEFNLIEIFESIESCKCSNASLMLEEGNEIMYIGAKKKDNGSRYYVSKNDDYVTKGNCIVFICDGDGSLGLHTYQENDFIGSTTLKVGRNGKLNQYNALFLITILDKHRYKFCYGRSWSGKRLKNTKLTLPAKLNNKNEYEPDWEYMENYIKSLPYGDII